MLDVESQLRDYFEEVVERVTAEDVRVRVSTERGVRIPERRLLRLRPLAAGAIGFGVALTLLGIVLVTDRLFAADVGDATGGPTGLLEPGAGTSPWLIIPVVVGVVALVVGVIFTRNTQLESRGGQEMQTMERDSVETTINDERTALKRRNRLLGWLSAFLAVAVIGLGAWLVTDSDSGASLPSEVEAALDNYLDAWEATDQAAFLDATTADYTLMSNGDETTHAAQAFVVGKVLTFWRVETVDRTVAGDGPYYVASSVLVYNTPDSPGYEGQSVLTLEQVDGSWKVSQHTWIGNF